MRIIVRALLCAVLCSILSSPSAAKLPHFQSFDHIARGRAVLDFGETLTISNIGSSGEDGVSIMITSPESFHVSLADPLVAATLPDGTGYAVGITNGVFMGSVTGTDVGGVFDVFADYTPIGSPRHTVRIFARGELVVEIAGHSSKVSAPIGLGAGFGVMVMDDEACIKQMWSSPQPILVDGVGVFDGDTLALLSETGGAVAPNSIGRIDLTGVNLPAVQITEESFGAFGHMHRGLGQAQMTVDHDHLTISNIGSSGDDGVEIDISRVAGVEPTPFGVSWGDPFAPLPPPQGARLDLLSYGDLPSQPNTPVGGIAAWKDSPPGDPGITILALFDPLQPMGNRVQIFDQGLLVDERMLSTNAVARVGAWPSGGELRYPTVPNHSLWWAFPVDFVFPDQSSVQGDEIRVMPENPTVAVVIITALTTLGTNLSRVDITGEGTVGPPPAKVFGLTHESLGQATMALNRNGQLVVSNIGSSGDDGVEVHIGPAVGYWVEQSPGQSTGSWDTEMVALSLTGDLGSVDLSLGASGNWILQPDFSPIGSALHTVHVFDGESLVGSFSGLIGAVETPNAWTELGMYIQSRTGRICLPFRWPAPTSFSIPGVGIVTGDGLTFESEMVAGGDLQGFSMTGADVPEIQISREQIWHLGQAFGALGTAQMQACHDCLVISNIGSSGDDGVCVESDPGFGIIRGGLIARMADPSAEALPGATLSLSPGGVSAGAPVLPIGSVDLTDGGSGLLALDADFSPLGATGYHAEAWNEGTLVASMDGLGFVADLEEWPDEWGAELGILPCVRVAFDTPAPISFPNTKMRVFATELTIEPLDPQLVPTEIVQMDLTAANFDVLQFLWRTSGTPVEGDAPPGSLARTVLDPNYPNPFNPSTRISFTLNRPGHVRLGIYTVTGRRVSLLLDEFLPVGPWIGRWDGNDATGSPVASGAYYLRLEAPDGGDSKKMVLLK